MKRKEKPHSKWLRCARFVASQYEKLKPLDSTRTAVDFDTMTQRAIQLKQRWSLTKTRQWKVAEAKAREDYQRQLRVLREQIESELSNQPRTKHLDRQ